MAVVGFANVGSGSAIEQAAETVGEGIIDAGHRLVTGGLGGVMAAASRGARRSKAWQDGSVVGVLPGTDPSTANTMPGWSTVWSPCVTWGRSRKLNPVARPQRNGKS